MVDPLGKGIDEIMTTGLMILIGKPRMLGSPVAE